MTTTVPTKSESLLAPKGRAHWIEHYDPEDAGFWAESGRRIANRNLIYSIFAEFLGFCVWALWSIVVPKLPAAGISLTLGQQFWLVSLPALVGATLRIPYSFAVTRFGGRNWTIVSALLLLIPSFALVWAVSAKAPYEWLLVAAALAGLGGGNFASSMTNISFFFPEAEKGRALGLNAAGGNLGTGIVQMVVPMIIVIGGGLHPEYAGWLFVPLSLLAAFFAWRFMDNLGEARSDFSAYADAARNPHTWLISFLYIGTFGSFVGYSAAFPTLLASQFPEQPSAIAFVGAVTGALARPLGGIVSDKLGGAWVTVCSFAIMALGAVGAIFALGAHAFGPFVAAFVVMFIGAGIGNGSTYRMIPAAFRAGVASTDLPVARRAAAACLGIAGAIGAYGGFLIPQGFKLATTTYGSLVPALWLFIGVYLLMGVATTIAYARPGTKMAQAGV